MKKIGEGYYYNVYKIDNNRVLKLIKTKIRTFLFIFFANKFNYKKSLLDYRNVIKFTPKLKEKYSNILNLLKTNKEIIGNPQFINDIEYTQDLIKNLRNVNSLQEKEFVKVVTDYIFLLKRLWNFGISDGVFNFSINCGYNNSNILVLIDFNEVTFNKIEVAKQINNQIWLQRASYLRLTEEKQGIFKNILEKELTIENLNKNWIFRDVQ